MEQLEGVLDGAISGGTPFGQSAVAKINVEDSADPHSRSQEPAKFPVF
jgi:hypothetical protein